MNEIVRIDNLSKKFGSFVSVSNLFLTVNKGDIYGFLGLNGSGKTTTIRMLLGMVHPTKGSVSYFGKKLSDHNQAIWNQVGYMVETPYAYPNLSVKENLTLFGKLRGINSQRQIEETMEMIQISAYANVKVKYLSLGNTQKLGLGKALLHRPSILILDEPTNGLDPSGIVDMRRLLYTLAKDHGVTIFLSSHILDEMEKLITRMGILHHGQLIRELTMNDFKAVRKKSLRLKFANGNPSVVTQLKRLGFSPQTLENNEFIIKDQHSVNHPEQVNKKLASCTIYPSNFWVQQETLEEYFIRTIKQNGG
ncbi:ABC transporter ATP-binding protein [Sporolactobacillus shoreicorticis]|uniref:ABC transporter ATP-binding protein n=1 Tax=Sporolactobacillus shoreicorticis TaxID=1923877 RepID=A0ABW5S0N1_9BACL|nr:ABC transporter ATP-binding protein [Sporolactobacillus shoreicorticis]MCO7124513.1 ABC transporter ATP-binding protein [Sporolactobacillus shoreicorticis]